ncbi:hypothetical protein HYH02_001589 [Chlamydomonas schloesseri]|uniref:CHRD domain-containing protein n=1 Tax=Chlamydomonas schloesseri TaxID=2026947 RepID=A0A836BBY7_9CHLO|nr:hypothetical protein HYH02_001589 [Chlamydomonas schloesseri]|eukprot:KAG2453365.1 hypothetical protein HYH02_001589 [Chlamydomonas schloesseri]
MARATKLTAAALLALCLVSVSLSGAAAKSSYSKKKSSSSSSKNEYPKAPKGTILATAELKAASGVKSTGGKGYAYLMLVKGGPYTSYIKLTGKLRQVTMAHVHWMNATAKNPIRLGLFPAVTAPATPVLLNPPFSYNKGEVTFERPWNETDIGYWGVSLDTFLDLLRNRELYVNVHTVGYPGGEIQGTLKCKSPCRFD